MRGLAASDARDDALELIEKLYLAEVKDVLVRHLSRGEKRKLNLAIALIGDPKIIVLDEPTG